LEFTGWDLLVIPDMTQQQIHIRAQINMQQQINGQQQHKKTSKMNKEPEEGFHASILTNPIY